MLGNLQSLLFPTNFGGFTFFAPFWLRFVAGEGAGFNASSETRSGFGLGKRGAASGTVRFRAIVFRDCPLSLLSFGDVTSYSCRRFRCGTGSFFWATPWRRNARVLELYENQLRGALECSGLGLADGVDRTRCVTRASRQQTTATRCSRTVTDGPVGLFRASRHSGHVPTCGGSFALPEDDPDDGSVLGQIRFAPAGG